MDIRNTYFRYAWLSLLIFAAAYVRVHGTNAYYFHADELMHMKIAEGATLEQVLHYSLYEAHPPLGHIIRHFWNDISQASWYARTLSLVFGLATILIYYAIGRKMHGDLTGMCAATLVAFSHGCIIQSYVVRNYSMLTFFLGEAFYCYLLWKDDPKNLKWLAYYFLFACCACLTHFSTLFMIVVLVGFETIKSYVGRTDLRDYGKWIIVNAILILILFVMVLIWHDELHSIREYSSKAASSYTFDEILMMPLLYIAHISSYLLSRPSSIYLLAVIIPLAIARKDKELNTWLGLMALALALSFILFLTKLYPVVGDRHALWMLSFFIPPVAWILADGFLWVTKNPLLAAIAILICGGASYDAEDRFTDSLEYRIKESQWPAIAAYLANQDSRTLIISGRTDGISLAPPEINIYSLLTSRNVDIESPIPYYHTHLFIDKTYQLFGYGALTASDKAYVKNVLKDYDKVIFMGTFLSPAFTGKLITCSALDKNVVSFPAVEPGHIFNLDELRSYEVTFVEVKKQDIIDEVLPPHGKAAGCMNNASSYPFPK